MRASRRSRRRVAGIAVAIAIVTAACSASRDYGGPTQLKPTKARVEDPAVGFSDPPPSTPVDPPKAGSRLRFVVRNASGSLLSDIPVAYQGVTGDRGIVQTRAGVATVTVSPGAYRLTIPAGCAERVIVKRGDGGTANLVEGEAVEATFVVEAERRYWPGAPSWRPSAPWSVGDEVRFQFLISDRCDDARAPGARFDDLVYRASAHLTLIDTRPQRADANGYGHLTFRCAHAGDAELRLEDAETGEAFELLGGAMPFTPDADWCAP